MTSHELQSAQTLHQVASEYVELDNKIDAAKALLKNLNAEKRELGDKLLEGMIVEGAPSVEIVDDNGLRAKVYPSSRTFASKSKEVDQDAFLEALRATGNEALIKANVNSNSLSALVREMIADKNVDGETAIKSALDPRLASVLSISTAPTMCIRRAK